MGDVASLVGPIFLAVLGAVCAAIITLVVAYIVHEIRWTRREQQVRFGGPANRTLADRLAEHQIEPGDPAEWIVINPHQPERTDQ